jgi:error-prone DNA polymerase
MALQLQRPWDTGTQNSFERFLSEERGEWPDIDLDLPSDTLREKVIQHGVRPCIFPAPLLFLRRGE